MEHPEKLSVPYYVKKTEELARRNIQISEILNSLEKRVKEWPESLFIEYNQNINIIDKLRVEQPLTEEEYYGSS